MALEPVGRVTVDLAGMPVVAQILKAQVGRIPLFILDTNVEENSDEARAITDNLYGGGEEHRLRQEILLGIGGVRALESVGRTPQVFHINEGHAGFLALERLRVLIRRDGLTFPEAVEAVRAGAVFTTHTPVSAGIDRFPRALIERYFSGWAEECGVAFSDLMERGLEPLVGFVRKRLKLSRMQQGISEGDLAWCDDIFDPGVLTIGFARRFAAYKRPTLLLSQPERLKALLNDPERPVQILFAGKAHPADEPGKAMIREIFNFAQDPEVRRRMAFLENYDMSMAKLLCQGVDLWLNTPRRPLEASGTSGEKAALNGVLNCSILDGWWDEMYDGENGWAILSVEGYEDLGRRDRVEAANLFDVLERRIVPLFYDRKPRSVPRGWVRRIRSSLKTLGPKVSATRMLREYVEWAYDPAAARAEVLAANGYQRAKALAAWKATVQKQWSDVAIEAAGEDDLVPELGTTQQVLAQVRLGALTPDDVAVQLVHGPVGQGDYLMAEQIEPMEVSGKASDGTTWCYKGSFSCERPGRYGYALRVVPSHPDLLTFAEVGRVAWASTARVKRICD